MYNIYIENSILNNVYRLDFYVHHADRKLKSWGKRASPGDDQTQYFDDSNMAL